VGSLLRNHTDLQEGEVYLFRDEQYQYQLQSQYGQYEMLMGGNDPHAFTRWPKANLAQGETPNTIYLTDSQVDKLIADGELAEI